MTRTAWLFVAERALLRAEWEAEELLVDGMAVTVAR